MGTFNVAITLQRADKATLLENIDPWISLVSHVEGTILQLEEAFKAFDKEEEKWHEGLAASRKKAREDEKKA